MWSSVWVTHLAARPHPLSSTCFFENGSTISGDDDNAHACLLCAHVRVDLRDVEVYRNNRNDKKQKRNKTTRKRDNKRGKLVEGGGVCFRMVLPLQAQAKG